MQTPTYQRPSVAGEVRQEVYRVGVQPFPARRIRPTPDRGRQGQELTSLEIQRFVSLFVIQIVTTLSITGPKATGCAEVAAFTACVGCDELLMN